jgi:hypothetical protein
MNWAFFVLKKKFFIVKLFVKISKILLEMKNLIVFDKWM